MAQRNRFSERVSDQPVSDTDAVTSVFDKHAGVQQPFGGAFLNTEVDDVALVRWRVGRIDQRKLCSSTPISTAADHTRYPRSRNAIFLTLSTPK